MRTALLTTAAVLALTGTAAVRATTPPPAPFHENLRTITPATGSTLDAEVDPATDRLYISSSDGTAHHLTVYDTVTGAPVGDPVELPSPATVMALGAPGTLYLGLSTRIAVYDTANRTVADHRLPVEGSVSLLAADPGQGRLYVGNQAAKSVTVYDTGTGTAVGAPVALPFHPAGLAVDTTGHTGYATYVGGAVENGSVVYRNILNAVDGATGRLTGTVSLGTTALGSMGVTVDPAGRTGYVANLAAGTVSVVDLAELKVTGSLAVDGNPKALAYDPGTTTLYAARTGASSVAVVDPGSGTVTETVATGERPAALALDPTDHTLFTVAGGAVTQTLRKTPTPPEPTPTQEPTSPTTGPTDPTPTATTTTPAPPTQEPTDPAPSPTGTSPTPIPAPTSTSASPATTAPTPTDSTSPAPTSGGTTGAGDSPGDTGTGPIATDDTSPTGALAATGSRTLPIALTAASLAALGGTALVLTRRRAAQEETATTP
ncbi:hypothetical protein [Streptomyces sp. NBC_00572]|uniref:hypothetical protein n=1 Tax=Streptomyces sp. NBC_00572 TaxID=2903664 RepID=UPI0022519EC6|nr:hypothetical protein [Streptomyces sp. NBC_00572]MCX4982872.1 hypothetical protein [Streptomyces sp. NBC_00572]